MGLALVLALAMLGAAFWARRWWIRHSISVFEARAARAVTSPARRALLHSTRRLDQLEAIWAVWERSGASRRGLLYADCVARKRRWRALTDLERAVVEQAERTRAHAATLPVLRGRSR